MSKSIQYGTKSAQVFKKIISNIGRDVLSVGDPFFLVFIISSQKVVSCVEKSFEINLSTSAKKKQKMNFGLIFKSYFLSMSSFFESMFSFQCFSVINLRPISLVFALTASVVSDTPN